MQQQTTTLLIIFRKSHHLHKIILFFRRISEKSLHSTQVPLTVVASLSKCATTCAVASGPLGGTSLRLSGESSGLGREWVFERLGRKGIGVEGREDRNWGKRVSSVTDARVLIKGSFRREDSGSRMRVWVWVEEIREIREIKGKFQLTEEAADSKAIRDA
jgi:hypothetical protein